MMVRRSLRFAQGELDRELERAEESVRGVYDARRDTRALRARLSAEIDNPEYWRAFDAFLHGRCDRSEFDSAMRECLATGAAKRLHNEFVRALLFNARFAIAPPRPLPPLPRHCARPAQRAEVPRVPSACAAAELGRLPTPHEIRARMRIAAVGLSLSDRAPAALQRCAQCAIGAVLRCAASARAGGSLSAAAVARAVERCGLSAALSPRLAAKYVCTVNSN